LLKERQILGVYWGEAMQRDPALHAAQVGQLSQWFFAGKIRPEITEVVPLSGAADAIERMSQGTTRGKIVVAIDHGSAQADVMC